MLLLLPGVQPKGMLDSSCCCPGQGPLLLLLLQLKLPWPAVALRGRPLLSKVLLPPLVLLLLLAAMMTRHC